ncbi:uncharacterized protein LOC113950718 [Corapipo altera]|uniref:uncharacterized protein LOC113950718 n=1 Tax=Corapipo altera TaxID=415028 RepID=UPI000FD6A0B3|nr:uncharacterized protein LOC113950718 [Corapipo altera]
MDEVLKRGSAAGKSKPQYLSLRAVKLLSISHIARLIVSAQDNDDGSRRSQCPELEDHDCKNDQFPVDTEIVQDLLLQLDRYKSVGLDGIHPRILRELADSGLSDTLIPLLPLPGVLCWILNKHFLQGKHQFTSKQGTERPRRTVYRSNARNGSNGYSDLGTKKKHGQLWEVSQYKLNTAADVLEDTSYSQWHWGESSQRFLQMLLCVTSFRENVRRQKTEQQLDAELQEFHPANTSSGKNMPLHEQKPLPQQVSLSLTLPTI